MAYVDTLLVQIGAAYLQPMLRCPCALSLAVTVITEIALALIMLVKVVHDYVSVPGNQQIIYTLVPTRAPRISRLAFFCALLSVLACLRLAQRGIGQLSRYWPAAFGHSDVFRDEIHICLGLAFKCG